MKKGIEVWAEYDSRGRWNLCIQKKRGHFTLDEIIETAREYEEDFYAIIIDAEYKECEPNDGDFVRLYRASTFLNNN